MYAAYHYARLHSNYIVANGIMRMAEERGEGRGKGGGGSGEGWGMGFG